MKIIKLLPIFIAILLFISCKNQTFNVDKNLEYCLAQAEKTAALIGEDYAKIPRNVNKDKTEWRYVDYKDWTSGFWAGIAWYAYDVSKNEKWRIRATNYSKVLTPLAYSPANDHDLGFQIYCSFGNGLRLTGDTAYKRIILATADTLATLFNPKAGTILSWPREIKALGGHNTIADNMMNLELLFWASKNGTNKKLYDIAVNHAETTMQNHVRPDFSAYHVVIYDTITGQKIKGRTHQGYADESMWARGQAWLIYGYTMTYRETKDERFLGFAQNVADIYLKRLPKDLIPYWDFDDPSVNIGFGVSDVGSKSPKSEIQNPKLKDASAAAITASALLELSTLVKDASKAKEYQLKAENMLAELSQNYQSKDKNTAFLLHSTGHKPNGTEVDASINYADYYYFEALLRLKKLQN